MPASAQSFPPTLVHQSWGDRSEGLLSQLVGEGDAIALVSALASQDAPATFTQWPATLRLRFYVPPGASWLQFSHIENEYYERYYKPELVRRQAVHDVTWGHPNRPTATARSRRPDG